MILHNLHTAASVAFFLSLSVIVPGATSRECSLVDVSAPTKGWTFHNGAEFPGAKGGVSSVSDAEPQHRPALRLDGDFTDGGNYVDLGRDLPSIDLESLSFWLKTTGKTDTLTLRVIDGTGQCHQINLRIEKTDRWQHVVFPIARYFEKAGTSASVDIVTRYEGWGGAQDGKWHNPAKAVHFLVGRHSFGEALRGAFLFSGMKISAAAPKQTVTKTIRLDDVLEEGEVDWSLNLGWEFDGGAKGAVTVLEDDVARNGLRLVGDFTEKGAYIAAEHSLEGLDVIAVRMQARSPNVTSYNVRYGDSTGQCHQGRNYPLVADNQWHEVVLPVASVAGGEHWGGANDGTWHPGAKYIALLLGPGAASDKRPVLELRDIVADVLASVAVSGEAYKESFESTEGRALPAGWSVSNPQGGEAVTGTTSAFDGRRILRIERTEAQENAAFEVLGAPFAAAPGPWSVGAAVRSSLHSPDNSFTVRLHVDALAADGGLLERVTLVDQCKESHWKSLSRQIELPKGTVQARFSVSAHKTRGTCDFDALVATPIKAESAERLVERILIDGRKTGPDGKKQTNGHLFYPDEAVEFDITAESVRPISATSRIATVRVTDYWGAEQFDAPLEVPLASIGRTDGRFGYAGHLAVPTETLSVGKYYEVHVTVAPSGYAETSEYSAFARLPEAEANRYEPRRIPFQIRNWDSRIRAYFDLAHRIGHRNIGLWGDSGWDYVERLGAGWYTGGFAGGVERNGWQGTTPEKIYQETFDLLSKHKDDNIWFICQGNEPNENPAKAREKVEAYEQVYKAAHAAKPDIVVVGTSVPALDCFFEQGFGKWCDVYDFHVYETYENVRQGVRRYKEMGKKYGCEKPVWCTELGLNSQGQTRYAVAGEVVKKITAFFAEGGASVSWFTIQYPDPNGKARGTGGDAHNTFDCQYNLFNPRLDAIMYYNMINGICVKAFAQEIQHSDGVQQFLFRDETGDCLLVLWKEGERVDRGIALPDVASATLTRIDGSRQALAPRDGALTLGLSGEPVLLRFRQPAAADLPRGFAPAALAVDPAQPLSILKGRTRSLRVTGPGLVAAELRADLPPRWSADFRQDGPDAVLCTVAAPAETDARIGRVALQRVAPDASAPCAEIMLSLSIMSPISVETSVLGRDAEGTPGIRVSLAERIGTDPARTSDQKFGKYDYSAGVGTKGPQAWCHLAAHSSVLAGAAPWRIAEERLSGGSRRYELAIPWSSLAPFVPTAGADLGVSMIVNEDDGQGRIGYTGWFAGPHTKNLDHIGDLVLLP